MSPLASLQYRLIRRRYIRLLKTNLEDLSQLQFEPLRHTIKQQADSLLAANTHLIEDNPSHYHVAVASLILASYRALLTKIPDREAVIGLLKSSLLETYRRQVALPLKLLLTISRDRFRTLTTMSSLRSSDRIIFGRGFSVSRRREGPVFDVVINKCLYHRFFVANEAAELTQVICHSDHAWIDAIDRGRHGVGFERPNTIGYGGESCVFRFVQLENEDAKEQR